MAKWNNKKKLKTDNIKKKEVKKGTYFFTKTMKHQIMIMVLSVVSVSLIVGGSAYAVFTSLSSSDYNTMSIGSLELTYDEDENTAVNLDSVYPVSDEEGLASKGYDFKLKNTGTLASTYVVYIGSDGAVIKSEDCNDKLMDYEDIKVSVNGQDPTTLKSLSTGKYDSDGYEIYKIEEGTLQPGETKKFNVKMWINIDAGNDVLEKHFHGKIVVNGENYNTYTTDALKIWYDGINNTQNGTNNSAATWYDLSNNNNNSSTFIGNNTWDNDGLNLNGVIPFVGNINSEYTMSVVVKPKNEGTNPYIVYGNDFPSLYLDSSNNYALTFKGQGIEEKMNDNISLSTDTPSLITITYKNNELTIYKNSSLVGTFTTTTAPTSVATAYIGGNNGSNNLKGKVYSFMLYDKALSYEEIRTNYLIDSTRFDIK